MLTCMNNIIHHTRYTTKSIVVDSRGSDKKADDWELPWKSAIRVRHGRWAVRVRHGRWTVRVRHGELTVRVRRGWAMEGRGRATAWEEMARVECVVVVA